MKKPKTARDLILDLWPEVFQTEESARAHPAREAKRLGATAPGATMQAVSKHATDSLVRLGRLAEARGVARNKAARAVGQLFSLARSFGSDLILSSEKSYRATILGIHHGIGVFALLEDAALAANDQELADFCASHLTERRRLALAAEEALSWFAEEPGLAAVRAAAAKPKPKAEANAATAS